MGRHKRIEDDVLLAQVRQIVIRDGVHVSSHKMAKEIGVSNAVLFQRYGSKENLIFAAMTPPAPDLEALLVPEAADGDVLVYLEQVILGIYAYLSQLIPVLIPLMAHSAFQFEAYRRQYPDSPLEKISLGLMTVLERKQRDGEIDCPDMGAFVFDMLSVAGGVALFNYLGVHGGENDYRRMLLEHVRLAWRGLAPQGFLKPVPRH